MGRIPSPEVSRELGSVKPISICGKRKSCERPINGHSLYDRITSLVSSFFTITTQSNPNQQAPLLEVDGRCDEHLFDLCRISLSPSLFFRYIPPIHIRSGNQQLIHTHTHSSHMQQTDKYCNSHDNTANGLAETRLDGSNDWSVAAMQDGVIGWSNRDSQPLRRLHFTFVMREKELVKFPSPNLHAV
jgi:hypothetical protein